MVVCLHFPRFELTIAAGGRSRVGRQALSGQPLAIAPAPGGPKRVGEVSGAAEAHGVVSGMALGEALARCPSLRLLPADPLGVSESWETVLEALEGIGAEVEAPRPGLAFFEADGLLRLHGGGLERVIAAADAACAGWSPRIGAGPARFCALAAALSARARSRVVIVQERSARRWLSCQPVELLRFEDRTELLLMPLRRLGVRTLRELSALGRDALADRFGSAGILAHGLACGQDTPLVSRPVPERLQETLELDQADSGPALERILGVLVERLLAHPQRRGRTLRAVTLSARLVEGGTWHERVVFREAIGDARRMCLALAPRIGGLPAPAETLRLGVACFGPPSGEQQELIGDGRRREAMLKEAVGQARAAAGPDAALRVVSVDPASRVPERRTVLAPFEG